MNKRIRCADRVLIVEGSGSPTRLISSSHSANILRIDTILRINSKFYGQSLALRTLSNAEEVLSMSQLRYTGYKLYLAQSDHGLRSSDFKRSREVSPMSQSKRSRQAKVDQQKVRKSASSKSATAWHYYREVYNR